MSNATKIYIAAASAPEERERVDRAFDEASRIVGVEIIGDWRPAVDAFGPNSIEGDARKKFAQADLDAVREAHALWLLVPERATSTGCWVELGAAITDGGAFVVVSGAHAVSIFTSLTDACVDTDAEALERLRAFAAE